MDKSPGDESLGGPWQGSAVLVVQPLLLQEIQAQDGVSDVDKEQAVQYAEMLQGRYVKVAAGAWRQAPNYQCFHDARLLLVYFDGTELIAA